ncbi:MAG: BON domain-containing protein [Deltaproteobacteria bacterium]|nr:BON domain-containing protein [Deltaproteobacteria bacterium]
MKQKQKNIINGIKAILTRDLHIDLVKSPIHLKIEKDTIVMEGMVEGIAQKKKALLAAMGVSDTTGVIDRLRVKPSVAMGDKEIKKYLLDAFDEESAIDANKIVIDVKHGIVDIEGEVPSLSHKRLAGVFAWWVPGSIDVINSLEVIPPEEDCDDEITDAVKLVFEKDRFVHEGNISVSTKNYVVTLDGIVGSEEEKRIAENDAWYVWGVNEVENKLKVVR